METSAGSNGQGKPADPGPHNEDSRLPGIPGR
jgi:hypothetical protein